jgi:hypothetical protein
VLCKLINAARPHHRSNRLLAGSGLIFGGDYSNVAISSRAAFRSAVSNPSPKRA